MCCRNVSISGEMCLSFAMVADDLAPNTGNESKKLLLCTGIVRRTRTLPMRA